MHWLTKPGTSLPEETRISLAACRELRTIPAVRNCGSHIGQADFSDEVVNVDFGENWVSVDPEAADEEARLDPRRGRRPPGLFRDVLTYLREGCGSPDGVEPRDRRPDLRARPGRAQAGGGRVRAELAGIDGLVDLHVELQEDVPHIEVETKLRAARAHGLKPGDIRRAAATLTQGIEVNDIWRPARVFDVNVWSTPETRRSLSRHPALPIDTCRWPCGAR